MIISNMTPSVVVMTRNENWWKSLISKSNKHFTVIIPYLYIINEKSEENPLLQKKLQKKIVPLLPTPTNQGKYFSEEFT